MHRFSLSALLGLCWLQAVGSAQAPSFRTLRDMIPVDADNSRAVALADVDGDGDVDAVVGNHSGPVRLYKNDGGGRFELALRSLPSAIQDCRALLLEDFDRDGDRDLLVGNYRQPNQFYVNDGQGTFWLANVQLPYDTDPVVDLAAADLDGDGFLEVVISTERSTRLYGYVGSSFQDLTHHMGSFLFGSTCVDLGDVDGDGDLDLFLAAEGARNDLIIFNDGSFPFQRFRFLPSVPDDASSAHLVDLNNDGNLDLIRTTYGSIHSLFRGDGTGGFNLDPSQLQTGTDWAHDSATGDFDGDGDHDLLIASVLGYSYWVNDGSGNLTQTASELSAGEFGTWGVETADLDRDGDLDFFIANGNPNGFGAVGQQNRVYFNDAAGNFVSGHPEVSRRTEMTQAVALADLDRDSDLDAVIGNFLDPPGLLLNDGGGVFVRSSGGLPALPETCHDVVLEDVNADGRIDVILALGANGLRLLMNTGAATFVDRPNSLPSRHLPARSLAMGDVDGDGDPDLVVGRYNGNERLLLNNGQGFFVDGGRRLPSSGYTRDVILGDVDGDGDLDAVVANGPLRELMGLGAQTHLYLNDGLGNFARGNGLLPNHLDSTQGVALGDIDGDGDLDLYKANILAWGINGRTNPQDRLYENDGTGRFVDVTYHLPVEQSPGRCVSFVDLDGDSDLDAVLGKSQRVFDGSYFAGTQGDPGVELLRNDGTGRYTSAPSFLDIPDSHVGSLAVGDIDRDGDLDLMLGHMEATNRLLVDVSTQLSWRALPRIGKRLEHQVHGAPGAFWLRSISAAEASIDLGLMGVLRLDPLTLSVVEFGQLDLQGQAITVFDVPNDAFLVGQALYSQGITGSPLRLTNLVVERFSGF